MPRTMRPLQLQRRQPHMVSFKGSPTPRWSSNIVLHTAWSRPHGAWDDRACQGSCLLISGQTSKQMLVVLAEASWQP